MDATLKQARGPLRAIAGKKAKLTNDLLRDLFTSSAEAVWSRSLVVKEMVIAEMVIAEMVIAAVVGEAVVGEAVVDGRGGWRRRE